MPREWTENRRKVAEFIKTYIERHGRAPTMDEIADATDLWKRSVEIVLKGLEKIGVIEVDRKISRGIKWKMNTMRVPLLGEVRAGVPMNAQEAPEEYIHLDPKLVRFSNPVALRVEGYSMRDAGILPDDIILIRPQQVAEHGETIIAYLDGGLTVKKFIRDKKKVGLEPSNPSYKTIWITRDNDFSIVGKVMVVLRDLGGCFEFRIEKRALQKSEIRGRKSEVRSQ